MKSGVAGKNISGAEVLDITPRGLWLLCAGHEYFLRYEDFPWFKDARVSDIAEVKVVHSQHLYWPKLDIDLSIKSLSNLENYPLIFR